MKMSLVLPLLVVASPALAQSAQVDLAPAVATAAIDDLTITVVATGSRARIDTTGQAITVLGRDEIEAAQGFDLTRALERVPGLVYSRNGGPGAFTGVRLRGSEAEQVLVLYDGIRVEDVSAPSGGFDFATLSPSEIERIDVLRSSNSVTWGSAAMGGVIAVTSRALTGLATELEYGSNTSFSANAALGLASDAGRVTLSGGHSRSDGVSAAAVGSEADGFSSWHVGARGQLMLAPGLALVANARHADTRTDIDGFAAPEYTFGDTPEYQQTRQNLGYAGLDFESGALALASGVALARTERDYFDPTYSSAPSFGYQGRALNWTTTGLLALPQDFALNFGAAREWTRYAGTYDAEARTGATGFHAQLSRDWGAGAVAIGLRRDDNDTFGGKWTTGANATVRLSGLVRLRASFGEAFKAPTLYQLMSDYGNAVLVPETSRSFDLGVDFGGVSQPLAFSATLFRRDSRELIAFVSCASLERCADRPYGLYDNIARARAQGIEVQAALHPVETLEVQAIYSFTDSQNRTADSALGGNDLPRRPRHSATFTADWMPLAPGPSLGADVRWVGTSYDDAGNFVRLASYALVALRASMPFGESAELYGRIENLFDVQYETTATYGSWGRAAFVGLRLRY